MHSYRIRFFPERKDEIKMWQLKKAYYRAFQKIMKIAMYAFDWSEPELLEGPGAIDRLPALIESKGLKRVLIVTDQGLMKLHILD